eukprot:COSAG01_NODE_3769_length_5716_cov_10.341641_8_plen_111_part_00
MTGRADKWDAEMLTATRPLDNHPDESMFVVDERVLAFDPLASVYKSKVLRRRFRRPVDSCGDGADADADADAEPQASDAMRWEYLIHYLGWPAKFDEWVDNERVCVPTTP